MRLQNSLPLRSVRWIFLLAIVLAGTIGITSCARSVPVKRETGTVKWFNGPKGYGFIARKEGEDIFVHYSEIKTDGRQTLAEGQIVEFTVERGEKGLQAKDVRVMKGKE
jgi:cold shock protein